MAVWQTVRTGPPQVPYEPLGTVCFALGCHTFPYKTRVATVANGDRCEPNVALAQMVRFSLRVHNPSHPVAEDVGGPRFKPGFGPCIKACYAFFCFAADDDDDWIKSGRWCVVFHSFGRRYDRSQVLLPVERRRVGKYQSWEAIAAARAINYDLSLKPPPEFQVPSRSCSKWRGTPICRYRRRRHL
jgi:hypothetical protein